LVFSLIFCVGHAQKLYSQPVVFPVRYITASYLDIAM